jgi:hypothetical protein
MTIYLDLDDTLIHSVYGVGRNPGKRTVIALSDNDVYHTLLRPLAPNILSELRRVGTLKMLTTAAREYAQAHNTILNLGFNVSDIIAREDFICQTYGLHGEAWTPTKTGTDPSAILIDNLSPNTESSRIKIQFLGIKSARYFQVREFYGKDPACFQQEIQELLQRVAGLAEGNP